MLFLAVDDENLQLNKLVDALKEADPKSEILSFNNPLTALEAVKNVKIDVAFLDIEMGGINGVELGKRLKSINPNINIAATAITPKNLIPFLALTATFFLILTNFSS